MNNKNVCMCFNESIKNSQCIWNAENFGKNNDWKMDFCCNEADHLKVEWKQYEKSVQDELKNPMTRSPIGMNVEIPQEILNGSLKNSQVFSCEVYTKTATFSTVYWKNRSRLSTFYDWRTICYSSRTCSVCSNLLDIEPKILQGKNDYSLTFNIRRNNDHNLAIQ